MLESEWLFICGNIKTEMKIQKQMFMKGRKKGDQGEERENV